MALPARHDAAFRWFTVLLGGVEPVVSDPRDELAAVPDIISSDGAGDFSAFAVARWPGLVRLAFGLTGDWWAAEDIAQTALARAYVSWRRVSRADDPDAYLRRILVNTSNRRFRRRRVASAWPGSWPRPCWWPRRAEASDRPMTGSHPISSSSLPGSATWLSTARTSGR